MAIPKFTIRLRTDEKKKLEAIVAKRGLTQTAQIRQWIQDTADKENI